MKVIPMAGARSGAPLRMPRMTTTAGWQTSPVEPVLVRLASELSPATAGLKNQLRRDAAIHHPSRPAVRQEWTALFEVE